MNARHRYPTRRELECGVEIECRGSGDPDLEASRFAGVRLLLCDGFPMEVGDDDSVEAAGDRKPPRSRLEVREPDPSLVVPRLEIHVRLPRKRRWFALGVAGDWLETVWRPEDSWLLMIYVERLLAARRLYGPLGLEPPVRGDVLAPSPPPAPAKC